MNITQDWLIIVREQELLVMVNSCWKPLRASFFPSLFFEKNYYLVAKEDSGNCFVVDINEECTFLNAIVERGDAEWLDLRSQLSLVSTEHYQLASRALQLVTWRKQHRFCGQCGGPTEFNSQEQALHCRSCSLFYYPRISPCMMCLITKGDYCLLAQHQKHRGGFYSTLAGFVEAGETIESTLHREVMEEVGLKVKNLQYFSTQSWPFPHQLMVGYFADYASGNISIDDDEIFDAQWFHFLELPDIPRPETLSGMMIREFVKQRKYE